ncbi:unnamed protein product [Rhizophagus irregularis]|nr:unnamed protein product [Rhizophagus irregularis]
MLNNIMNINISKDDENFLKNFLKDFHKKIIETNDFSNYEYYLSEWVKFNLENNDKNPENILKMMENHDENKFWFTSLLGFFYQFGIGCYLNREKALDFYYILTTIDNNNKIKENDDDDFNQLNLIEKNDDTFDLLRNNNIVIGKYLLSLFYYKDNILFDYTYKQNKSVHLLKLSGNNDLELEYNSRICFENDDDLKTNYRKIFELLLNLADNENLDAQYNLAICYMDGIGTYKDETKAFDLFLKSDQIDECLNTQNEDEKYKFEKNLKSAILNNSIAQNDE